MSKPASKITAPKNPIYGVRGAPFRTFLHALLALGQLPDAEIDHVIDYAEHLYEAAFTHSSISTDHNYEHFEFLGDLALNKAIPWYLLRRFPKLAVPNAASILSRLKINLVSSKVFAKYARQFMFLEFISSDLAERDRADKLMEDAFEAFFGVTELVLDEIHGRNVGFDTCYRIIETMMDLETISFRYEDLYDAKTRLKELFDFFRSELGSIEYNLLSQPSSKPEDDRRDFEICIFQKSPVGAMTKLGYAKHPIRMEAEQLASQEALTMLNNHGYVKYPPKFYNEIDAQCAQWQKPRKFWTTAPPSILPKFHIGTRVVRDAEK